MRRRMRVFYRIPMRHALLLLSFVGILMLTACNSGLEVKNGSGKGIGKIMVEGAREATYQNMYGDVRGKVRGNIVRDDSGKNLGTIAEQDGNVVLLDAKENPLGSLAEGKKCYGKGQDLLGTVPDELDTSVAGGACLVYFLQ
ncbi:hypothetical protein EXS70_03500 [Candidatus Peribacteria bacterium]|nr:hypothetical protein [Candidatus Peribacteria bacterium]